MEPKTWLVAAVIAFFPAAATATTFGYVSTDVSKTISAGGPSVTFSSLQVPDAFIIESLTVQLRLLHTWRSDIDLFLIGPTGITVELSTDNGGSLDDYFNTVFDDAAATSIDHPLSHDDAGFAGSYRPEQPLSNFANTSALGLWRLQVTDDALGEGGELQDWRLTATGTEIPEPRTWVLLLAGLSLLGFLRRATRPSSPA